VRITDTSDLWYKNAVVYCLDVKRYADSNGDGWGDFVGLSRKVDYLADLGVTCIWLMPFYPSPLQDDGYDIADFYTVDPRLGSLGDVVDFLRTAHDRGIRVIADLVPNHTSVEHPWFQSARKGPDSPFHDWYVWSDDPPPVAPADVAFPGEETSIWQYDEECGRYYLHRFYRFQPDLDVSNPEVRNELTKIAGFWTELGIDGFRMDAVPAFLQMDDDAEKARLPDPHDFLRDLRAYLGRRRGETFLLGEANLPHDQQRKFFGDGSSPELSGCFDFITMANLWLSMARGEAAPLAHAVESRPEIPPECQWATFVRNHDELTLDRLTPSERDEVF
jgi:maltose alpha-D-glucosyltransferase/alpha-amylase